MSLRMTRRERQPLHATEEVEERMGDSDHPEVCAYTIGPFENRPCTCAERIGRLLPVRPSPVGDATLGGSSPRQKRYGIPRSITSVFRPLIGLERSRFASIWWMFRSTCSRMCAIDHEVAVGRNTRWRSVARAVLASMRSVASRTWTSPYDSFASRSDPYIVCTPSRIPAGDRGAAAPRNPSGTARCSNCGNPESERSAPRGSARTGSGAEPQEPIRKERIRPPPPTHPVKAPEESAQSKASESAESAAVPSEPVAQPPATGPEAASSLHAPFSSRFLSFRKVFGARRSRSLQWHGSKSQRMGVRWSSLCSPPTTQHSTGTCSRRCGPGDSSPRSRREDLWLPRSRFEFRFRCNSGECGQA